MERFKQKADLDESGEAANVEVVVDAATVDDGLEQRLQRVPRNLLGRDVGAALRDVVDPLVDGVHGALRVRLGELELLAPANRRVAQTLEHDRVQPRQQEVQARALHRRLVDAAASEKRVSKRASDSKQTDGRGAWRTCDAART